MVLHGLDSDDAVESARQAMQEHHGVKVAYVRSDLACEDGAAELIRAAESACGAIDILVNNAVVRHFAPIDAFPVDAWTALAVICRPRSIWSAWRRPACARAAGPDHQHDLGLRRRGATIASTTCDQSALLGFTRAVAMETLADGITCNAVSPGSVLTPGTDQRVQEIEARGIDRAQAEREFLAGKQPSGRFVRPEDVAASVAYLCSPAARDITGTVLPVDGGWLAS